jgi:DNA-binding response OmpR family regulator
MALYPTSELAGAAVLCLISSDADAAMAILIVNGDPNLLDVLCFMVRHAGYDAVPARDASAGYRHWQAKHPDLVLIDVDLPSASGWALCQQVRQASSTPVILLTASWTEADAIRGFALRTDDYVSQPFSLQEIVWRVRTVLRRGQRVDRAVPEVLAATAG